MTRTSYITAISLHEQATLQLYHDQNKIHYSYIMTRTSYITAISCQEQVGFDEMKTMSYLYVCFMVFNTTFNNISVISVLLVEETGGPG
jgi:hypothetical protein